MKTIAEMIAVMEAFAAGKRIQVDDEGGWIDCQKPGWDWARNEYRVKPEPAMPREFWISELSGRAYQFKLAPGDGKGMIHVREVKPCHPCSGTGKVMLRDQTDIAEQCLWCHGTGQCS